MEDVEQGRIEEHERAFESPKKPLVGEEWAEMGERIDLAGIDFLNRCGTGKVLDDTIDCSDGDEDAADIKHADGFEELRSHEPFLGHPAVVEAGESEETKHADELNDQSGLEQSLSSFSGRFRSRVAESRAAIGSEDAYHEIEPEEGGDDSTGVDGGEVRDIVEDTTEHDVVGAFVYGWGDEEKDIFCNEQVDVAVVASGDGSTYKAGSKEDRCPDEEESRLERLEAAAVACQSRLFC